MTLYHITPKGEAKKCNAKIKCRYGVLEAHYENEQQAYEAIEAHIRSHMVDLSNPLSVIPVSEREKFLENTDSFVIRPDASLNYEELELLTLAHYHFNLAKITRNEDDRDKAALYMRAFRGTPTGNNYTNYSHMDSRIPQGVNVNFDTLPKVPRFEYKKMRPAKHSRFGGLKHRNRLRKINMYANDCLHYVQKLTPIEQNVLSYWSNSGSGKIIRAVLKGESPNNKWDQNINYDDPLQEDYVDSDGIMKVMESAFKKADLEKPIKLYRGFKSLLTPELQSISYTNEKEYEKKILESFHIGKELELDVPQSASLSYSVGHRFSDHKFMIEYVVSNAAPIGSISAWGMSEEEYIIPHNKKYVVRGIRKNVDIETVNGKEKITLIQIEQLS